MKRLLCDRFESVEAKVVKKPPLFEKISLTWIIMLILIFGEN